MAARLAEKQRLAKSGDSTSAKPQGGIAAAIASSTATAAAPASVSISRGFGSRSLAQGDSSSDEEEGEGEHSSEDEDDHLLDSSDEEQEGRSGLTPQAPREASQNERRPLDDSSSSSSEDDDNDDDHQRPSEPPPINPLRKTHASTGNLKMAHLTEAEKQQLAEREAQKAKIGATDMEDLDPDGEDLEIEDYWRLGELRQAAAQRAALVARSNSRDGGSSGSLVTQAGISGSSFRHAKKKSQETQKQEQEKMLLGGGLAEREPPDDEDEDEPGVQMGAKYLPRRASASGGAK